MMEYDTESVAYLLLCIKTLLSNMEEMDQHMCRTLTGCIDYRPDYDNVWAAIHATETVR